MNKSELCLCFTIDLIIGGVLYLVTNEAMHKEINYYEVLGIYWFGRYLCAIVIKAQ